MGVLEDLKDGRSRWTVVVVSALSLGLSVVGLYLLYRAELSKGTSATRLLLIQILSGAVTAFVTTVFIVLIARLVAAREAAMSSIVVVDPGRTAYLHKEALKETEFWHHDGHIGRWVRTAALPALAKYSNDHGANREVILHIMNPLNLRVCTAYADYRSRLATESPRVGHYNDTVCELVATTLMAVAYNAKYSGLTVRVYFKDAINFSRTDLASSSGFITLADPRCNALIVPKVSSLDRHGHYEAMRLSFDEACTINTQFVDAGGPSPQIPPSPAEIRDFVTRNNLIVGALSATHVREIGRLCKSAWSPFR